MCAEIRREWAAYHIGLGFKCGLLLVVEVFLPNDTSRMSGSSQRNSLMEGLISGGWLESKKLSYQAVPGLRAESRVVVLELRDTLHSFLLSLAYCFVPFRSR